MAKKRTSKSVVPTAKRRALDANARSTRNRSGGERAQVNRSGFTDEERAAMKERARELKAEARASKDKAAGESSVLSTINALPEPDRKLGSRIHEVVRANAPSLIPKLWYGMPAYANQEGKVVCFFQAAAKFKTRYASFSFTDASRLDADEEAIWPIGFGLKSLNAAEEAALAALIRRAVA